MEARLELIGSSDSVGKERDANGPPVEEKRPDDDVYWFGPARSPKFVLALCVEARTLRFEGFIDLRLDMIKLTAKAADKHLAYLEESMRQELKERSRN